MEITIKIKNYSENHPEMEFMTIEPCILRSRRLLIRPHQDEDVELLNRAVLDSFEVLHEWMDWAAQRPTLKDTQAYIDFSKQCWRESTPPELPLLIFDASGKHLIGSSGYHTINWEIPTFEIGYWVNIHFRGQGYITEAVNILTRYGFAKWNPKRIEIRCDSENKESFSIPERLGFLLDAHFKNHRVQPKSKQLSGTLVFVRYDTTGLTKIEFQEC